MRQNIIVNVSKRLKPLLYSLASKLFCSIGHTHLYCMNVGKVSSDIATAKNGKVGSNFAAAKSGQVSSNSKKR